MRTHATQIVKPALLAAALWLAPGITGHSQSYTFTTLAGTAGYGSADGAGSAARFKHPCGAAADYLGKLCVADTHNKTIRKIIPDGVVTTLAAGAGSSGNTPTLNLTLRADGETVVNDRNVMDCYSHFSFAPPIPINSPPTTAVIWWQDIAVVHGPPPVGTHTLKLDLKSAQPWPPDFGCGFPEYRNT
jgi:hypothetical protein